MNPHLQPWTPSADAFPGDSYASDQLEFLLGYAILAPSPHNTQPWRFRINVNDAEIYADRHRALPVADPRGRELTLACGAALCNLRVAAEYFGRGYTVALFPKDGEPDLLASLTLHLFSETSSEDVVLFHALTQRHTNRQPFAPDPVPDAILTELADAAACEGAWLAMVTDDEPRRAVADLVAEADRIQWGDRRFRRELANWLRTDAEHHADGIPTHDLGVRDWMAFAGPALIRTFNRGNNQAARDTEIATHSPVLAVLGTENDEARAWLQAGQALERVLLHARSEGVWASFLNQPIEVSDLRANVAGLVKRAGFPQVLLRLGYGSDVPPTPRRSVRSLLIKHETSPRPQP